jgi:imidazolonepropionase
MRQFVGISQLVQPHAREGSSRSPLDIIPDAVLVIDDDGRVAAAGPRGASERPGVDTIDLGGRAVVPGLVDSHTHVVHAGERIDELARRTRGESYEDIARAGGGIVASIEPLHAASVEHLVAQSRPRVERMLAHGTTTAEAKSGYGMTPESELKQLRAIAALDACTPMSLVGTVLAHVIPPDRREERASYVDELIREVILVAAREGLARFCDVFVETVAFTVEETRLLAAAAREAGLGLKLHVDQLHDGGGAALAAELGALSADHLEMTAEPGRRALAAAGVVACILPGCALFLGKGPWPNGRALRDVGCEVAVATDCNPGSAMVHDLALCASIAATRCGLSLEEALWGATRGGARALGLDDRGRLVPGERGDFVVVEHADWRALLYRPGDAPIADVCVLGESVAGRATS